MIPNRSAVNIASGMTNPILARVIRLLPASFAVAVLFMVLGAWPTAGFAADRETKPATKPSHGIAIHGEPKYPPGFKHFEYADPNAPKGGTLRRHTTGTFDSFNPYIIKGNPAAGLGFTMEALMTSAMDEPATEYGQIAESVETPPDRSWVAFTLHENARWHDGKPITVDDVIFSLETLKQKGQPFFRFYYANVAKVEQTGPRTVKFTFAGGENRELPVIMGQLPVLPKHYWQNREFDKTTLTPPLGSGPYKIKNFEPGRFITYERVKDYWGADIPVNKGANNFDIIRYDYYRDDTVALEAFKAGEYDFRLENSSKAWATSYDSPALRAGWIKKDEIRHHNPSGMQGFAMNLRRPLFKDRRVRRALAYAFDFEWSNQNLFYGQYTRTKSYFDNSDLASSGLPGPEELKILEPLRGQIPEEVFTTPYAVPKTDGSGDIRANLREAFKLLRAAGWTFKDRKLVNAETGRPFRFEILLISPLFERIVLPYIRNLKRLGIDARVRTVDSAQYRRRLDDYDFDVVVGVLGQSLSPGNEQREFWGSDAAGRQGSRNIIGIRNPAIDKLIDLLIAAPDRRGLIVRTRALDRVLLWGHYVVPHWHINTFRIAYWDIFGRPEINPDYNLAFMYWWMDRNKAGKTQEHRKIKR
ncbi:MAG: extracellular solute-binding protein [Rhodospirillales bacterium]